MKAILKVAFVASNTTQAVNGFVLHILRYIFGVINVFAPPAEMEVEE